jgi:lipid II:glycine glycyltransferase (peptidoglycan interpeptide bridge formation enzyme)
MKESLASRQQMGSEETWDEAVTKAGGHVLQSYAWGELKASFGWRVERLALKEAQAQVLFRPLPGGLGTLAYVPKGPVVDYADVQAVRELLEGIEALGRERSAICLKIEPNLEASPALEKQLRGQGFRPSPQVVQPRRTIVVDLRAEPEALLRRMKSKTRYNIRLAGRKGVTVRHGTGADLAAVYQLMEATAQRDGFGIHTPEYYKAAFRLFERSGRYCLLLAEHEGQLLAALVAFAFGDTACYMYGASSDEHRNRMPTYLLQWRAMTWAKEQGCLSYDLWGVPDEEEEVLEEEFTRRHDGLWGVYRFKRGFGGRLVRTAGAWDLVYAPVRYRLYAMAVNWLDRGQEA